ncbi:MAG: hypothetical protein IJ680_06895 [Paludibacteraceae bacterium]|nr:hypothetical protein [Paludibacteraceae bacterium]
MRQIDWKILILTIVAVALFVVLLMRSCRRTDAVRYPAAAASVEPDSRVEGMDYARVFNDLNDLQLEAATGRGIVPLTTRDDLQGSIRANHLRHVRTNRLHQIDPLTHSSPYLMPHAARLLDDLGRAFADTLARRGLPPYRFIVTSMLRTQQDQADLSSGNVNATANSTHCYATTFDITYARFAAPENCTSPLDVHTLTRLLGHVIKAFRQQDRCYVKYENQQPCFHITAR